MGYVPVVFGIIAVWSASSKPIIRHASHTKWIFVWVVFRASVPIPSMATMLAHLLDSKKRHSTDFLRTREHASIVKNNTHPVVFHPRNIAWTIKTISDPIILQGSIGRTRRFTLFSTMVFAKCSPKSTKDDGWTGNLAWLD